MFVNDLFENADEELFSPSAKAKVAQYILKQIERYQLWIQRAGDEFGFEHEKAQYQLVIEKFNIILNALQKGGIDAASKAWHEEFYKNAYNGQSDLEQLRIVDMGLGLNAGIEQDVGISLRKGGSKINLDESDDMFANRWYTDQQVRVLISRCFRHSGIGNGVAREWHDLTTDPDDQSHQEVLDTNNDYLEQNDIPFVFTNWKWNDEHDSLMWTVKGAVPTLTENNDDIFAPSTRVTNLKSIIFDIDYVANKMVEDPEQVALDMGWDNEDIDEKIIDDVMSASHVFNDLVETFKKSGLEIGLRLLDQLRHHDNPAVAETAMITIDEIRDIYDIDIKQYINEDDNDMFAQGTLLPSYLKKYIGKPIIGTATVVRDLHQQWDWADSWQVDTPEELPPIWKKFYDSAGKTLPLVELGEQESYAVIYVAAGMPLKVHTHFFRDFTTGHTAGIVETDDDYEDEMFASNSYAKNKLVTIEVLKKFLNNKEYISRKDISPQDLEQVQDLVMTLERGDYGEAVELWARLTRAGITGNIYWATSREWPRHYDMWQFFGMAEMEESVDNGMFADVNLAKGLSRIMWDKGYRLDTLNLDSMNRELAANPRLKKQANDINYSIWDLWDGVVFNFEERLQNQRNLKEQDDDDMFANAFRVERDVMEWQEKAAENYEGYERPRGMQNARGDGIVYLYVIQKDGRGRCTGVYYSPQPATEETNIGTYNIKFQGNLEEYLKQDPYNPANRINENDDDLFADPRDELHKAIRNKLWGKAVEECAKRGIQNPTVEKIVIPAITSTVSSWRGDVVNRMSTKLWYDSFYHPGPWPELIQYVSTLKNKKELSVALTSLAGWYAMDSPANAQQVKDLILQKKNADAAIQFLSNTSRNTQRWPEMEPYIMVSPRAAMHYAAYVLKDQTSGMTGTRWIEAEPYIATDRVSWSMYSARVLNTNNNTWAGRAVRDEAQREALKRLPDGHKKRIAEEDDMFSAPRDFIATVIVICGETEFLLNKRVKNTIKEFLDAHGLRSLKVLTSQDRYWTEIYVTGEYDVLSELDQQLHDLNRSEFKNQCEYGGLLASTWNYGRNKPDRSPVLESDDDMFAPSKRAKVIKAIKQVLDSGYEFYMQQYNDADPEDTNRRNSASELAQDFDYLRSEFGSSNIKAFFNGLDVVDINVIETIDAELAIKHKVYLQDIEDTIDPLEENIDDDLFAPSLKDKIVKGLIDLAEFTLRDATEIVNAANSDSFDRSRARWKINIISEIINLSNIFKTRGVNQGILEWREYWSNGDEADAADYIDDTLEALTGIRLNVIYHEYQRKAREAAKLSENDEMFAPGKFQKWTQAIDQVLDALYHAEENNLQVNMEPKHVRATEQLMSDYDYLRSELSRGGIQAFINGLDMVDRYAIDCIDADLARMKINLSDIEKAFYPEEFNESDDDMFAPSKVERIAGAIDKLADIFTQHEHGQQSVHYCRKLAKTFRTQGIDKGVVAWRKTRPGNRDFEGGISQTVRIYVQKETGFDILDRYLDLDLRKLDDHNINESGDDMFSNNRLNINPNTVRTILKTLARRYDRYANNSTDTEMQQMYQDDSYVLDRAADAMDSGLRAGISELGELRDPATWDDIYELAADYEIDMQKVMDRYEAGTLDESEDDLFAAPRDTTAIVDALNWLAGHWDMRAVSQMDNDWAIDADRIRDAAALFARGGMMPGVRALDAIDRWDAIGDDLEYWHSDEWEQIQSYLDRLNEGDDLFAASKKANLTKINTGALMQQLQLITRDTRPEYASAHRGMETQIKMELQRRGVLLPPGVEELNETATINSLLGTFADELDNL